MSSADEMDLQVSQSVVDALGTQTLPMDQHASFITALQQRYENVLRVRRHADSKLPFQTQPVPWYSLGRRLDQSDVKPSQHLLYAAGEYYLQDAGSLLALAACGAESQQLSGLTVCDLCAAPGGKASALLEAIGPEGFLLANEPIRSRVAPLTYNLARTGSDRFAVSCMDPDRLAETLASQFDLVLVDAPCSGQALMGRGKQTQAALSTKQIQHSAARQQRILDSAVRLLRPGGQLVYSTCTFAQAENEAQVDRLVSRGSIDPLSVPKLQQYQSGPGTYRLWPHLHQCAGSFAAAMTNVSDDDFTTNSVRRKKSKKQRDQDKDTARIIQSIALKDWFDLPAQSLRLKLSDAVLYGWPENTPDWIADVAVDGPELSHRTGQTWKPAHAAAIRRSALYGSGLTLDVDAETAVRFLGGAAIACQSKGWHVVRFLGLPLGWVKASSGTGKNHLPHAARFTVPLNRDGLPDSPGGS